MIHREQSGERVLLPSYCYPIIYHKERFLPPPQLPSLFILLFLNKVCILFQGILCMRKYGFDIGGKVLMLETGVMILLKNTILEFYVFL